MNNTLPLPQIAQQLSQAAGITPAEATHFIRQYFEVATQILIEHDTLSLRDLGVFSLQGDAVDFHPAETLARMVNSPFEAFTPITLPPGFKQQQEMTEQTPTSVSDNQYAPAEVEVVESLQEEEVEQSMNQAFADASQDGQTPPGDAHPEADEDVPAKQNVANENINYTDKVTTDVEKANVATPLSTNEIDTPSATQPNGDEPVVEHSLDVELTDEVGATPQQNAEKDLEENHQSPAAGGVEQSELSDSSDNSEPQVYIVKQRRRFTNWWLVSILFLFLGLFIGAIAAYLFNDKLEALLSRNDGAADTIYIDNSNKVVPDTYEQPVQHTGTPAPQPVPEPTSTFNGGNPSQPLESASSQLPNKSKEEIGQTPKVNPTPQVVQGAPSQNPQPVYDVVTQRVFLTTLAGKHYGEKELWPYIYQANKGKLKHPDRIPPGTRLIIPPKSSLPLTGNTKDDIVKAKRLGTEIYNSFK